jgi:hypothetical protein
MARLTMRMAMVAMLLALPAAADASSPWGWLDKLSGPGPFDANGRLFVPVPITKTKTGDRIFTVGDGIDQRQLYVVFETARFTGETNPNFAGAVNISTLQGVLFVHPAGFLHGKDADTSPVGALDFGAGFGLYRFSGAGVISDGKADGAFWRGAIPLRIRLTPSELFAGRIKGTKWRNGLAVFSYMIGWDVLPGTFDDSDFVVSPAGAGYHSSGNAPFTCGLIIDVTPVFFHK